MKKNVLRRMTTDKSRYNHKSFKGRIILDSPYYRCKKNNINHENTNRMQLLSFTLLSSQTKQGSQLPNIKARCKLLKQNKREHAIYSKSYVKQR